MRENPLYKLLDVRMGGKMVEVFEEEGAKALKTFCRQHFEDEFLYNSGEGEIITHSEYARWRHYQESKNREVCYLCFVFLLIHCEQILLDIVIGNQLVCDRSSISFGGNHEYSRSCTWHKI